MDIKQAMLASQHDQARSLDDIEAESVTRDITHYIFTSQEIRRTLGTSLLDGVFMSWETHLRDQPSAPGLAALIRLVPNIVHFVGFAPA